MAELLRPHHKLKVGDIIEECDRFSRTKNYTIYKITQIDYSQDYGYMEVIISSHRDPGNSVGFAISAHACEKHTGQWLTYYHPNGRVLFGTVNTD